MKHVYGHTGNHKNNVPIMPPHLGLSALCPVITLLHVRFVITLIPLLVLVLATTLETSWKNCVTLELKQHRYLTTGVSAMFLIGLSITFTHALHYLLFALSFFPVRSLLQVPCCTSSELWKAQHRVFLPLRVLEKFRTQHVKSSIGAVISGAGQRRLQTLC